MYSANQKPAFQGTETISKYEKDLVRLGLITMDQLAIAKISRENLDIDLASILIKKGFVTEQKLLEFVANKKGVPFVTLKDYPLEPEVIRRVPLHVARQHLLVPISQKNDRVQAAMSNPFDTFAIDDLKNIFRCEVEPMLASSQDISAMIDEYFDDAIDTNDNSITIEVTTEIDAQNEAETRKIQEMALGPKVVASVNNIIARAEAEKASDIHIEPQRNGVNIRYRIDGLLRDRGQLAKSMLMPVVSRIKILAGLDIAERRIPQDGRVRVMLVGKPLDMRISTCPTQHGEKIVIRLLAKDGVKSIEALGFDEKERKTFADIISKNHGIFLVTGPTGSGKSTTLYAALSRLNSSEKNIISIEDPIESDIAGVNQVSVNVKQGLTFAGVLRSVLRQDPDVIMLGEIRDGETGEIAVRAAITGHMVLSTLHTNSAAGAISRLMDLGVQPFLLASALKGVLAQRLVRKICSGCKTEVPIEGKIFGPFTENLERTFQGKGCKACGYTGYSGRAGIFELAPITEEIVPLVARGEPDAVIETALRKIGVRSMVQDGIDKVNSGVTTIEEILRVTQED